MDVLDKRILRAFFIGALVLSAAVLYGLAMPVGLGFVLGYVCEKPINGILTRLHRSSDRHWRRAVTGGFILTVLLVLFLPVSFSLYIAIHDLVVLLAKNDWTKILRYIERLSVSAGALAQRLGVELPVDQISSKAADFVAGQVGSLGSALGTVLGATPDFLFNGTIVLLAWYASALDGRTARDRLLPIVMPWPRERELLRRVTAEVIESVIVANVMVSVVQALICTFFLLIFQVPRAIVWGVLAFFLSFIPIVGTAPITLGAALYCFSHGRTVPAIVMVVVAVVVGAVDNILRPLFMRSSEDLSLLWLLVAFVGGVAVFGLSGVIIGPLAFSLFLAFLSALEREALPPSPPSFPAPPPTLRPVAATDEPTLPPATLYPLPSGSGRPPPSPIPPSRSTQPPSPDEAGPTVPQIPAAAPLPFTSGLPSQPPEASPLPSQRQGVDPQPSQRQGADPQPSQPLSDVPVTDKVP